jgi:RNA polymerase sigma factor for flagellar operon FliA
MKHDHSSFTAQTTAKRAYGTDATARIAQFMPMVRKLAWYYESSCGGSLDVDDLQQAGLIALTECAQRHDRPNDDGFAAYAKMRVRGAMIDLLRSQSNLARGAAALGRRIERMADELRSELKREPSPKELARALGLSLDELHEARLQLSTSTHSIDDMYSDSDAAFSSEEPDAEERRSVSPCHDIGRGGSGCVLHRGCHRARYGAVGPVVRHDHAGQTQLGLSNQ